MVEVEDNGPGMPPEVRKRAFEPFFTTKPQGVGTGIGLSICHGIVAAHGGRIEVETRAGPRHAVPLQRCRWRRAGAAAPEADGPAPSRPRAAACWWWTTSARSPSWWR